VQWAYAHEGIRIPRVAEDQFNAAGATPVDRDELEPGDLVFFKDGSGYVHHVGMSLGGDKFVNAPHTGDVVKVSSLDEPTYAREFAGGRRFDHGAPAERADAALAKPAEDVVDERAVAIARAALERDAGEVARMNSALFRAIERQEGGTSNQVQFMRAIDPRDARPR
jgi:hypothetical protein